MLRVAVMFDRFGPYHLARLEAAQKNMLILGLELCGDCRIYKWDKISEPCSFRRETLFPDRTSDTIARHEFKSAFDRVLNEFRPDAVAIPGWAEESSLALLKWCLDRRVPAILMSETTAWDESRIFWKERAKSHLVQLFSSGLVGGTPHRDYLVKLGMPQDRVFMGYDAIDNDYFAARSNEARIQQSSLRKQFKLPDRYFLASARFVEKKNLPRLLEAYARYRELFSALPHSESQLSGLSASAFDDKPSPPPSGFQLSAFPISAFPSASLVLLGDGPLKSDLQFQLSTFKYRDSVLMPGFVQYPDLPVYYGLADAFIHASTTEQWGLVVNEAMASGLPVLVSNRCGCAADLVQEGVNGFTFDPCNVEQLAQLMLKISAFDDQPSSPDSDLPISAFDSKSFSAFGDASRKIISDWGPDRFATGLKAAVNAALSVPRPKATFVDRALLNLLMRRRPRADN